MIPLPSVHIHIAAQPVRHLRLRVQAAPLQVVLMHLLRLPNAVAGLLELDRQRGHSVAAGAAASAASAASAAARCASSCQ